MCDADTLMMRQHLTLFVFLITLSGYTSLFLTLWRPLLPYWYSYKASRARPG